MICIEVLCLNTNKNHLKIVNIKNKWNGLCQQVYRSQNKYDGSLHTFTLESSKKK